MAELSRRGVRPEPATPDVWPLDERMRQAMVQPSINLLLLAGKKGGGGGGVGSSGSGGSTGRGGRGGGARGGGAGGKANRKRARSSSSSSARSPAKRRGGRQQKQKNKDAKRQRDEPKGQKEHERDHRGVKLPEAIKDMKFTKTTDGKNLCFNFNMKKGCTDGAPGGRCRRGAHVCGGCRSAKHGFSDCKH